MFTKLDVASANAETVSLNTSHFLFHTHAHTHNDDKKVFVIDMKWRASDHWVARLEIIIG